MYKADILEWYYISGGHPIKYPVKDLWSFTYLDFAKTDFEECKESRNFVNAVSNAKRALHYQVDALATAFGWHLLKEKNDFPSKLKFLGKCGVIAPTIIRRINKFRNTIEHDYYLPTEEETEEYIDIVELYLMATHKITSDYPDQPGADLISDDEEYDPAMNYPPELNISFPEGMGTLKITHKSEIIADLTINDQEYFEWVSRLVQISMA